MRKFWRLNHSGEGDARTFEFHQIVGGKTTEYPFYVFDKGWIPAGALQIGDLLQMHDGNYIPVEGVADSGRVETVYNLEVEDYHTYFVGSIDWGFCVWAHNAEYGTPNGLEQSHPDLPVREGGRTHALLDGKKPIVSGKEGGSSLEVFKQKLAGLSDDAKKALTHVEAHAVAEMIKGNLKEAVLFINYKTGPCKFCRNGISELIEEGQKLWVVFPNGVGYFTKSGWTRV